MPQHPETLPYARNDPAVIAPWRRPARFRWLPAVVASWFFLFLLQVGYLLPAWGILPTRARNMLGSFSLVFPIVACFAALLVKRRGALRAGIAVSALAAVLSPGMLPLERLTAGHVDGGDVPASWLALGFIAIAACCLWGGRRSWMLIAGEILLAGAAIWALLLIVFDAVRFVPAFDWSWTPPHSATGLNLANYTAANIFIAIAWLAIAVLQRSEAPKGRGSQPPAGCSCRSWLGWVVFIAAGRGRG